MHTRTVAVFAFTGFALATTVQSQPASFRTDAANYAFTWYWDASNTIFRSQSLCAIATAPRASNCGVSGLTATGASSATLGGSLNVASSLRLNSVASVIALPANVYNWGYSSNAYASEYDRLEFTGVTPAYLRFSFAIDGRRTAISSDGLSNLSSNAYLYFGAIQGATPQFSLTEAAVYGDAGHDSRIKTNNYLFTRDVAILGTNPLSVSIRLLTASTINTCCAANVIPTLNGYIDTDFSHTLQWEVEAFDAQDHNITDAAALRLASGSPLPRILVAPEPSTLWFMSAGALALVFRNLWGQRRSVLRRMTVRER